MIDREIVQRTLNCAPNQYPLMLEQKFPHVLEKIINLWDSPDAEPYFADLLQPNGRGGGRMDRDGFPDKAWQEILQLRVLYSKPHPMKNE